MHFASVPNCLPSLSSDREQFLRAQESSSSGLDSNNALLGLPEEIILQILESAYYDDSMEPDYRFLSSCALFCKRWSAPSQSLLFRHASLRSSSAFVSFRSAIDPSTARGQSLKNNVVRLRVTIDHNHSNQISHRALVAAILSCPNLYELDLAVYGCHIPAPSAAGASGTRIFRAAPSFDCDTLDVLRTGPAIQSLKFANWSDNDQLAFQLLSDAWPSLKAVSLRGTPPRLPASNEQAILPFGCSLKELRLGFQTTPQAEFVDWLTKNSSLSLRSLELERVSGTEPLVSLLGRCGPSLTSLALPACTSREHVSLVHSCEKLKEFRFENASISPLLLKQLPSTIEHLAFSISRDTPLYLIVNFIKAHRHLKAVTVHVWEGAEAHPQIPTLRIACACNGVELRVLRGIRCFREAVRGDPVPCFSYPRFKEPSNLRRMLCISRHARRGNVPRSPARRPCLQAESAVTLFSRAVLSSPEFAAGNEVSNATDDLREKL